MEIKKAKQALGLVIGLMIGGIGGYLFSESLPPPEGSAEDLLEQTQNELAKTRRTARALENYVHSNGESTPDKVRQLLKDIREGKEVSPDDLLTTMKPWMRQMAPIFERIRKVNEEDWADGHVSEWSREYNLTPEQRAELKEWFRKTAEFRSKALVNVIESNKTGFVDLIQATEFGWHEAKGADKVMEGFLKGEELKRFKADRLHEQVTHVQHEADRNLTRLDEIVGLDASQHETLFGVMVRGSENYDQNLEVDGLMGNKHQLSRDDRDREINNVLNQEQRKRLGEHRRERRKEASDEMRRMGMTLPQGWDLLDGDRF